VIVPGFVVPAVKVTVPVTLAVGLVTLAVKVMASPTVEGFMEDLIDVLVVRLGIESGAAARSS
jgi:hypothetical protein